MSTLAQIRDRVEQVLADTGNTVWDTDWVDEGIRQALAEYNLVLPYKAVDSESLSGILSNNNREIDLSSWAYISDCYDIYQIWLPYVDTDTEPTVRSFEFWREEQKVWIKGGDTPAETETARIFFTKGHTIDDLDSASATTIHDEHETLLVNGAAGHTAASRALDLSELVTVDRLTAQQVRAWGLSKLQEFRAGLRNVGRAAASRGVAWVELPALDRWDKGQGE